MSEPPIGLDSPSDSIPSDLTSKVELESKIFKGLIGVLFASTIVATGLGVVNRIKPVDFTFDTINGITGGPVSNGGAIALARTGVVPGVYKSADLTVDAYGRVTDASSGGDQGEQFFPYYKLGGNNFGNKDHTIGVSVGPSATGPVILVHGEHQIIKGESNGTTTIGNSDGRLSVAGVYDLPTVAGNNGDVLVYNGAGTCSWSPPFALSQANRDVLESFSYAAGTLTLEREGFITEGATTVFNVSNIELLDPFIQLGNTTDNTEQIGIMKRTNNTYRGIRIGETAVELFKNASVTNGVPNVSEYNSLITGNVQIQATTPQIAMGGFTMGSLDGNSFTIRKGTVDAIAVSPSGQVSFNNYTFPLTSTTAGTYLRVNSTNKNILEFGTLPVVIENQTPSLLTTYSSQTITERFQPRNVYLDTIDQLLSRNSEPTFKRLTLGGNNGPYKFPLSSQNNEGRYLKVSTANTPTNLVFADIINNSDPTATTTTYSSSKIGTFVAAQIAAFNVSQALSAIDDSLAAGTSTTTTYSASKLQLKFQPLHANLSAIDQLLSQTSSPRFQGLRLGTSSGYSFPSSSTALNGRFMKVAQDYVSLEFADVFSDTPGPNTTYSSNNIEARITERLTTVASGIINDNTDTGALITYSANKLHETFQPKNANLDGINQNLATDSIVLFNGLTLNNYTFPSSSVGCNGKYLRVNDTDPTRIEFGNPPFSAPYNPFTETIDQYLSTTSNPHFNSLNLNQSLITAIEDTGAPLGNDPNTTLLTKAAVLALLPKNVQHRYSNLYVNDVSWPSTLGISQITEQSTAVIAINIARRRVYNIKASGYCNTYSQNRNFKFLYHIKTTPESNTLNPGTYYPFGGNNLFNTNNTNAGVFTMDVTMRTGDENQTTYLNGWVTVALNDTTFTVKYFKNSFQWQPNVFDSLIWFAVGGIPDSVGTGTMMSVISHTMTVSDI